MRSRIPIAISCLLLIAVIRSIGQESRGTILGRVTDPSGSIVENAAVRAVNLGTNTGASTKTNAEGNFELPYLLTGTYRLEVELVGFKKFIRSPLDLRVAERLAVNVQLEVGSLAEVVNVTAEAPPLETATASIGAIIDRRRVVDLPLTDGNLYMLALLTPGVVNLESPGIYIHPGSYNGPAALSVDGNPSRTTEFTLDGIPAMSRQDTTFNPPADVVDELKVETASYDSSVGYSPSGQINAVIKSGTNQLHGTLFEYNISGPMAGTNFFTNQWIYDPNTGPITDEKKKSRHPNIIINRFGGQVGGPVVFPKLYNGRNGTFFSYAMQSFLRIGKNTGTYTVPQPDQLGGDFSQLLRVSSQYQIYDPATATPAPGGRVHRDPFPGNLIPASRVDPMAQRILGYYPAPNVAGTRDGLNNYFSQSLGNQDYWGNIGRIDHVFNDQHRMFGRFTKGSNPTETMQIFPSESRGWYRDRRNIALVLDDVVVFNPGFLMNIKGSATRFDLRNWPRTQGMDLVALGFPASLVGELDPRGIAFPYIGISGLTNLGETGGDRTITNYYTVALNFTRMSGNHSIRFGAERRILQENGVTWGYVSPYLDFGTSWTRGPLDSAASSPSGLGQGLASALLGLPTGGQINLNPFYAEQSTYTGVYIHDDWKVNPRLTVNVGLRYERDSPITERFNRSVLDYDFSTPSPIDAASRANYASSPIPEIPASRFRSIGGLRFAGVGNNPRELWQADTNNLAPRIGLAYSISSKWVVRAGYGIFYDRLGSDRRNINLTGFSVTNSLVASPDNGLSFIASLKNPFPNGLLKAKGAEGGLSTNLGQGVSFFDPKPRNPYMQRWSFGVQTTLPSRMMLEVGYVGNRGTKLGVSRNLDALPAQYLSRSPERDQPTIDFLSAQVSNPYYPMLPGTGLAGTTIARSQLLLPYPHFTGISTSYPAGFSYYHSLQIKADKRFSHGFTSGVSYTWSKFMEATSYLNATDDRPEKVISSVDRPQRVVANFVYEFPFGPGKPLLTSKGWLGHVVGGWQVQGFYTGQSGPALGFGNALFRGDLHDIPFPRTQRTPNLWFNINAGFERSAARQLGSNIRALASRFTGVRADGHNVWNLSMIKSFRIREQLQFQLRAEGQNALNHPHFATPNTTPTSTAFGTVTAQSGEPRWAFIGARLLW